MNMYARHVATPIESVSAAQHSVTAGSALAEKAPMMRSARARRRYTHQFAHERLRSQTRNPLRTAHRVTRPNRPSAQPSSPIRSTKPTSSPTATRVARIEYEESV